MLQSNRGRISYLLRNFLQIVCHSFARRSNAVTSAFGPSITQNVEVPKNSKLPRRHIFDFDRNKFFSGMAKRVEIVVQSAALPLPCRSIVIWIVSQNFMQQTSKFVISLALLLL